VNVLSQRRAALLRKELTQLRRSRAALASSMLVPLLLLVVVPLGQYFSLRSLLVDAPRLGAMPLPIVAILADPQALFLHLLLPLFVTLSGLAVPSVTATHAIVAERERRSLELIMALPVTVSDILVAKMLAVLLRSAAIVVPLYAVTAGVLFAQGAASGVYFLLVLAVLLAALACSTGLALLLALLARDYRTAHNVSGALSVPLIPLSVVVLLAVPGESRPLLALTCVLLLVGILALLAGLRWLTFERYLA
jgi:ABC-2 type transport system permease protein